MPLCIRACVYIVNIRICDKKQTLMSCLWYLHVCFPAEFVQVRLHVYICLPEKLLAQIIGDVGIYRIGNQQRPRRDCAVEHPRSLVIAFTARTNKVGAQIKVLFKQYASEPRHKISNNMRSLIRAFASRLNILWLLSYWLNIIWNF